MNALPRWTAKACAGCGEPFHVRADLHEKFDRCIRCDAEHADMNETTEDEMGEMGKSKKKRDTTADAPAQIGAEANGAAAERHEIKRYTDDLPVRIDDLAVACLADEMALVHGQKHELEEKKKQAAAGFKAQIDGLEDRLSNLAESVRSKTVKQAVEVREFLNPDNSVDVVRLDTGEVIEKRTADPGDLQPDLFEEEEEEEDGLPGADDDGDTDPPPDSDDPNDVAELAREQGGVQP